MKAPKKVTRKVAKPRKGKRQDSPTALTMEELAGYPIRCANCSVTFDDVKLFCSGLCQAEAAYVRYVRRRIAEGRDQDPLVKEGIRIKRAMILGGGYNKKRRPRESVRQLVIDRDGGRCQICLGPGSEIDHKKGSSNDLANLQVLCDACHNKKTVATFITITKESHPEEWAKAEELRERVEAAEPRLCDSGIWDSIWEELMRKRRDVATGQGCLFT
jgi:5-methylcytosine-specific restriction endonuclease McrA